MILKGNLQPAISRSPTSIALQKCWVLQCIVLLINIFQYSTPGLRPSALYTDPDPRCVPRCNGRRSDIHCKETGIIHAGCRSHERGSG